MPSLIGQTLGRYHILQQLGEGGMAVVYKALDTRLERNVAIKVILPGKEHTEKFLKRFDRETKALASLSHPNIVKVIDYGEHDGLPFLVMEYLPGGTLKDKLSGKAMPWQEAVHLLLPIARALAHAHENKIVHRDVKPSNILITQSGEPMLSDFGIAKMVESEETLDLTGTGVGVGTPEYMSPEQAQGKPVDPRSDIYSLGIVFYEMVTGRKPYHADTPMAVVYKLASEPMPRPKQYLNSIPDFVENIILKATSKQPENRYQNFLLFTKALEDIPTRRTGKRSEVREYARTLPAIFDNFPRISFGIMVLILIGVAAYWVSSILMPPSQAAVISSSKTPNSTVFVDTIQSTRINPTKTPTLNSTSASIYMWDFETDGDMERWGEFYMHDLKIIGVKHGQLIMQSTGFDPYIYSPLDLRIDTQAPSLIEVRLALSTGSLEIFFITDKDANYDEAKKISKGVGNDGQFHVVTFDMNTVRTWKGIVTGIRLDPSDQPSTDINIDYIKISSK